MGKGDISELCRNCSRTCEGIRKSSLMRALNEIGQLREEIVNLKTNILVHLNTTLDGIQTKTCNPETLSIYYPRCRNKCMLRECLLDKADSCWICEKNHATNQCEILNTIKNSKKRSSHIEEEVNYMGQRPGGNFSYGKNSSSSWWPQNNWNNNQWVTPWPPTPPNWRSYPWGPPE